MRLLLVCVLVGCSASATPTAPPPVAKRAPDVPMSEPAEYDIDRISRGAGEAIFTRTGIGDPYKTGLPYPIFLALQRGYPQLFGADTQALAQRFGFVPRAADPASDDPDVRAGLPIGMHLTVDPITTVPFVVTSCSLCHTERLRWPGGEATIVGLGNKRVRIHAYDAAFTQITQQRSFTVEKLGRLAREAARDHKIAWPDQYADAFVGATIAALRTRAEQRAELNERAQHGPPGRVATVEAFVPALRALSGKHIDYAREVGWAKVPDVIGYRNRTTLSWDAAQEGPMAVLVVEADIATGARIEWLERHPFQGASLDAFLRTQSPRPTFPGKLDRRLAERGRVLFDNHCADCHGSYARDGEPVEFEEQVIALADIGTDPARANSATESFEHAANDRALTRGYTRFRRTFGYVPPVLTNVWARAPYGHAGQWPSLAVLAMKPEQRPTRFVVDLDAPYNLATVGVATRSADATPRAGDATPRAADATLRAGEYLHDASKPGFSVAGHPFLAELGADAPAVIEYLKTL